MTTQSQFAGNATSTGFGTAWTTVSNAIGSDFGTAAQASLIGTTQSKTLKVSGFGFTVPPAATIGGVEVLVHRFASQPNVFDLSVKLTTAGSEDKADTGTQWTTAVPADKTYGSASDQWGLSLTPAIVNGGTFGCELVAKHLAASPLGSVAQVFVVEIVVYYSEPVKLPAAAAVAARGASQMGVGATVQRSPAAVAVGKVPAGPSANVLQASSPIAAATTGHVEATRTINVASPPASATASTSIVVSLSSSALLESQAAAIASRWELAADAPVALSPPSAAIAGGVEATYTANIKPPTAVAVAGAMPAWLDEATTLSPGPITLTASTPCGLPSI